MNTNSLNPFSIGDKVRYRVKNRRGGKVVCIACGSCNACNMKNYEHCIEDIQNKVWVEWGWDPGKQRNSKCAYRHYSELEFDTDDDLKEEVKQPLIIKASENSNPKTTIDYRKIADVVVDIPDFGEIEEEIPSEEIQSLSVKSHHNDEGALSAMSLMELANMELEALKEDIKKFEEPIKEEKSKIYDAKSGDPSWIIAARRRMEKPV